MRKWWPLVAICLGTFMLLVDVTIVNVALPDMARELGTSFSSLQWVVDAYALTLAALLMGIGSIADIVGHRRAYVTGLAVFAVSSLACGLAPDAGLLIAARAVQGVGGAAMFATTFALLNSSYQGRDRGTAYGIWGAVTGASAAVGPIIGGLLTQGLTWRWIFFVNLPVSVAAIALALIVLSGERPTTRRRVDVAGMVAFTVAAAALTFAMIRASTDGWVSGSVLGLLVLGLLALGVFVAIQQRSRNALLDLALFHNRSFVGIMIAALLLNFAAFAYFTYTSVWLQSFIGLSPIQAGLTGLPLSAFAFLVSAVIGRFLHRTAPGPIIGGGLLLIGAGALISALLVHSGSSWPALIAGFCVVGVGVGLATPTMASTAMSAVTPERGGMAAGAVNTARQLGYAFGIAVLGSVFAARAAHSLAGAGVPRASRVSAALAGGQAHTVIGTASVATRGKLVDAVHDAFAAGLDAAFLVAGVAGILAGLAVLALVRPVRDAHARPPVGGTTRASATS
ncbi:MAG TPA: MFS transporter [Jatrophihabitantaceae bacterium]|jgi:EmrB/QacA subfamily drug resistance transporter|nr:MFS transporter [Jatrophihabitantaceae bacterium]